MKSKNKKMMLMSIWVTISALLQTIALNSFSVPGQIYPSGVTGLARLVSDVTLDFFDFNLPYYYLYLLINIILAIIVFKRIGRIFTIFSLIQVTLVSILVNYVPRIIFVDDKMLLAIFGGIINGIGTSLALMHNASTGGFDFLSIYYSSKYNKSMWNYLFIFNCIIVCATGIIYSWQRAMYSIIFQFCSTSMINKMHHRYTHQTVIIITSKPQEVTKSIFSVIRHGITEIDGKGAFKNSDVKMLYMVVNTYETSIVKQATLNADANAFISIQNTQEVVGNYYLKPLD